MTDEPTTTDPQPPVQTPRVEPTTANPPEATPGPEVTSNPPLTRDMPIEFQGKDGVPITTSLGSLADAFRDKPDQDTVDELDLYRRAVKGNDREAAQQLLQKYLPEAKTPVEPETSEQKELQELKDQVSSLQKTVEDNVSPVISQITDQAHIQLLQQVIELKKDQMPLLKLHPQGPQMVKAQIETYRRMAEAKGHDLSKLSRAYQEQVIFKAMEEVHTFLKTTVETLSGASVPKLAENGKTDIVSVNDQNQAVRKGVKEARWPVGPGGLVTMPGAAGQPQPAEALPATPVTPVPSGTPTGVQTVQNEGPLTLSSLKDRLRARTEKFV